MEQSNGMATMRRVHARHRDDVEVREDDEDRLIGEIIETMRKEGRVTEARYGRAVRDSHAKESRLGPR